MSAYQNVARNRTVTGNVIYSPSAYLLFSFEYRRIETSSENGPTNASDVIGVAAGYEVLTMTNRWIHFSRGFWCFGAVLAAAGVLAQEASPPQAVDVRVKIRLPKLRPHEHAPPVVVWLKPLPGTMERPFLPDGRYTLLQKNRMFTPHLLVVPVDSEVFFPNADPFYHNVFSLFNGKRF